MGPSILKIFPFVIKSYRGKGQENKIDNLHIYEKILNYFQVVIPFIYCLFVSV